MRDVNKSPISILSLRGKSHSLLLCTHDISTLLKTRQQYCFKISQHFALSIFCFLNSLMCCSTSDHFSHQLVSLNVLNLKLRIWNLKKSDLSTTFWRSTRLKHCIWFLSKKIWEKETNYDHLMTQIFKHMLQKWHHDVLFNTTQYSFSLFLLLSNSLLNVSVLFCLSFFCYLFSAVCSSRLHSVHRSALSILPIYSKSKLRKKVSSVPNAIKNYLLWWEMFILHSEHP